MAGIFIGIFPGIKVRMVCSFQSLFVVGYACRGIFGCTLESSGSEGVALGRAPVVRIKYTEPATAFVHPQHASSSFESSFLGTSKTYKHTMVPLLAMPLTEVASSETGLDGTITNNNDNTDIHVAVCTEHATLGPVDVLLLPWYRTVAASWRSGLWFVLWPLAFLPLLWRHDKHTWLSPSLWAELCTASDALLWIIKGAGTAYFSSTSGTSLIIVLVLVGASTILFVASHYRRTHAERWIMALASLGTGYFYSTTIACIVWALNP